MAISLDNGCTVLVIYDKMVYILTVRVLSLFLCSAAAAAAAAAVPDKEMFSFVDAGGSSVTLRPEGTASVVRAVLSQKLPLHETLRLFYQGPMFR